MKKIFLSSAQEDLVEERKEIILVIDRLWHAIAMEKFGAGSSSPKHVCLEHLKDADALVLILGRKYGSIDLEEMLSFTEIEYNFAIKMGIPIFSFIKIVEGDWFPDERDSEKRKKLESFKKRIDESHTRKNFSSIEELKLDVQFSLFQWDRNSAPSTLSNPREIFNDISDSIRRNDDYSRDLSSSTTQPQIIKGELSGNSGIVQEIISGEHNEQLKTIRGIINDKRPNDGIKLLKDFRSRVWDNTSNDIRYQIDSLHAIALLELQEREQAADLLIKALCYNPLEIKAIENAAYAYYIINNIPKSQDLLNQALSINPNSEKGKFISLCLLLKEKDIDDLISTISVEDQGNSDIAQLIGRAYLEKSNYVEAKRWFEKSLENLKGTTSEVHGILGNVLLMMVVSDPRTLNGFPLDEANRLLLHQAVEYLSQFWENLHDPILQRIHREVLLNRGIIYRLLRENTEFHQDIIEVYKLEKSDPVSSYYRAIVAGEMGDYSCSERIFSNPSIAEMPEKWRIVNINQLRKQAKFDEALRVVESGLEKESEICDILKSLQISIYLEKDDFDKACSLAQRNYQNAPKNIQFQIDFIHALRISERNDEALTLLEETRKQQGLSTIDIVRLADEAYYLSSFDIAIGLYEKVVDPSQNSEFVERFTLALFYSMRLGTALSICKKFREKDEYLKLFVEIEYYIYQNIGDVKAAIDLCKIYLERNPADFQMRYNFAVANLRNNHPDEVDLFLSTLTKSDVLTVEDIIKISNLFLFREREIEAIDLLYEGIRKYPNEPKLQMQYVSISLKIDENDPEWIEPERIGPNTVVFLKNQDDESIHYIIEERTDPSSDRHEISTKHQIAKNLNGKGLNDLIDIPRSFLEPDKYRIEKIQSKYVYRFQEIFSNFSHQFVGENGIQQIRIPETSEKDDTPPIYIPIKKQAERAQENTKRVQELYIYSNIPLGGIAQIRNDSIFNLWGNVVQDKDWRGICYSSNFIREQELAKIISSSIIPKLIIDPIALMTITSLNIGDSIVKKFGKLGIAQSTVDGLLDLLQTTKKAKEHISPGIHDGQLILYPFTLDDRDRYCQYFSQIFDWVTENCDIIPSYSRLSMDGKNLRQFERWCGIPTLDTMLICDRPEYLLFSDEHLVRTAAKESFQIVSVCTLTLLLSTKSDGENLFPETTQIDCLLKLLILNYVPINFSGFLIFQSCNNNGWNENESPFKEVIEFFEINRVDYQVKASLINLFIHSFWKESVHQELKQWIFLKLLTSMTKKETAIEIIQYLKQLIFNSDYSSSLEEEIFFLIDLWSEIFSDRLNTEGATLSE